MIDCDVCFAAMKVTMARHLLTLTHVLVMSCSCGEAYAHRLADATLQDGRGDMLALFLASPASDGASNSAINKLPLIIGFLFIRFLLR